jgi:hypothetical protein
MVFRFVKQTIVLISCWCLMGFGTVPAAMTVEEYWFEEAEKAIATRDISRFLELMPSRPKLTLDQAQELLKLAVAVRKEHENANHSWYRLTHRCVWTMMLLNFFFATKELIVLRAYQWQHIFQTVPSSERSWTFYLMTLDALFDQVIPIAIVLLLCGQELYQAFTSFSIIQGTDRSLVPVTVFMELCKNLLPEETIA